jgi:hypothetical protein
MNVRAVELPALYPVKIFTLRKVQDVTRLTDNPCFGPVDASVVKVEE